MKILKLVLITLLVPGTVFAMGIQITLIRLRLSDTIAGVVLVHLIAAQAPIGPFSRPPCRDSCPASSAPSAWVSSCPTASILPH